MKVLLNRNVYFFDGRLYERDRMGTVFPDEIDGHPVELYNPKGNSKDAYVLPRDAVEWTKPGPEHAPRGGDPATPQLLKGNQPAPTSLSELTPKASKTL